jgi:hypothetical protein
MNRDASPTRIMETEQTLFRVSVKSQWFLLYFCVCLECDVPILEALFHSKATRISPKGANFKPRLVMSLWQHVRQSYPSWRPNNSVSGKWIRAPLLDHRRLALIEDALCGIKLIGRGDLFTVFDLGVCVLEEEIWFTAGDRSCTPTVGQFFTVLDALLNALLETLEK